MTDTDPRLEAVAKAHRETEFPVTLSWDQREARRFIAMYDALRVFDCEEAGSERPKPYDIAEPEHGWRIYQKLRRQIGPEPSAPSSPSPTPNRRAKPRSKL